MYRFSVPWLFLNDRCPLACAITGFIVRALPPVITTPGIDWPSLGVAIVGQQFRYAVTTLDFSALNANPCQAARVAGSPSTCKHATMVDILYA